MQVVLRWDRPRLSKPQNVADLSPNERRRQPF